MTYVIVKSRFIMNVKLFIVMGISWMGEIVSALTENYAPFKHQKQFFYPMDILNCLQGLFIFILFVVKRRVHQALKKRLGFDEKKKFDRATSSLQDPFKMRKSVSNSTLTSTFAVSSIPWSSYKFYLLSSDRSKEIYIFYSIVFFLHRPIIYIFTFYAKLCFSRYMITLFISWVYRIAEIRLMYCECLCKWKRWRFLDRIIYFARFEGCINIFNI